MPGPSRARDDYLKRNHGGSPSGPYNPPPPGTHWGNFGLPERDPAPGIHYGIASPRYNGGRPANNPSGMPNIWDDAAIKAWYEKSGIKAADGNAAAMQFQGYINNIKWLQQQTKLLAGRHPANQDTINPFFRKGDYSEAAVTAAVNRARASGDSENKRLQATADGDRARLGAQAKAMLGSKNKDIRTYAKALQKVVSDPIRYDNTYVTRMATKIFKATEKAKEQSAAARRREKKKHKPGFFEGIGEGIGGPLGELGHAADVATVPTKGLLKGSKHVAEHWVAPAAGFAEQTAEDVGKNAFAAFQSMGEHGPGGPRAGSNQYGGHGVNLWSSEEQEAALQQYADDVINGVTGSEITGRMGLVGLSQALAGGVLDIAFDPLSYGGGSFSRVKDLGKVAELGGSTTKTVAGLGKAAETSAVAAARRAKYIAESKTGRAVIENALRELKSGNTVRKIASRVSGLDRDLAQAASLALEKGGDDLARKVLTDGFVTGRFTPKVSIGRQAMIGVGAPVRPGTILNSAGKASGYVGDKLGDWASGRKAGAGYSANTTHSPAKAIEDALRTTARSADVDYGAVARAVADEVGEASIFERVGALLNDTQMLDSVGWTVRDTIERSLGQAWEYGSREAETIVGIVGDPEFIQTLENAENLLYIASGRAGAAAAKRVNNHMATGFLIKPEKAGATINRAAKGLGFLDDADIVLPDIAERVARLSPKNQRTFLRSSIMRMKDSPLKDDLLKQLDGGTGTAKLQDLMYKLRYPEIAEEATRLASQGVDAAAEKAAARIAMHSVSDFGPLRRGLGRFTTSFTEVSSHGLFKLTGPNRILLREANQNSLDDLAAGLRDFGWNREMRSQWERAVLDLETTGDIDKLVGNLFKATMNRAGVDEKAIKKLLKAFVGEHLSSESKFGILVDSANRPVIGKDGVAIASKVPQTATQTLKTVYAQSPEKLRAAITEELAKAGSLGAKMRMTVSKAGEFQFFSSAASWGGKPITVAHTLSQAFHLWKALIVLNKGMPMVAVAAGAYLAIQGDVKEGAIAGATGFAIGLAGPVRYMIRNTIQERITAISERGLLPGLFPKTYAKATVDVGEWGLRDSVMNEYLGFEAIETSRAAARSSFLHHTGDDWVTLAPKDGKYRDAYYRAVNFQISPESDPIVEALLMFKSGQWTKAQSNKAIKAFLASPEGRIWTRRFKEAGVKGKDALKSTTQQVDYLILDADMAAARLNGPLSHDTLNDIVKTGSPSGRSAPEAIHAQDSWTMPSPSRFNRTVKKLSRRITSEVPTKTVNRGPLAKNIYAEHYHRLTALGNTPMEAREIAEAMALRRTNAIMDRADNFSRFSKKADYILPFQGNREFTLKVLVKGVAANPWRALVVTKQAAHAFNAGKEAGIFRQDPYGAWRFSVPGSAWASKALFGSDTNFSAPLSGLLMVQTGLFGSGWAPTPGGPYVAAVEKLVKEAMPELFDKNGDGYMGDFVYDLLFPYGPGGNIARPEVARLWMGLTNTVPPWEVMAGDQMQDTLNKTTIRVERELIANHLKKYPHETSWVPSRAEVKEGTSSLLKAWSLVSAFSPSSAMAITPNKAEFDAATETWKKKFGTDTLDIGLFLAAYPAFAPFFTSETKYVGPGDLKHVLNTDMDSTGEQKDAGHRVTLSYKEFTEDYRQHAADSAAYRERNEIYDAPISADEESSRLNQWYIDNPRLAKASRNKNIQRHELARIMFTVPKGAAQVRAKERFIERHALTGRKFKTMWADVGRDGGYILNPWAESRQADEVAAEVEKRAGRDWRDPKVAQYVSTLPPAEQSKYWYWQVDQLNYVSGDPRYDHQTVLRENKLLKGYAWQVKQAYPYLSKLPKGDDVPLPPGMEDAAKATATIGQLYTEAFRLTAEKNLAYTNANWSAYHPLKKKAQAAFDQIKAIANDLYQKYPDMEELVEDTRALLLYTQTGNKARAKVFQAKVEFDLIYSKTHFIPTDKESSFLNMTPAVQAAYVDQLVESLTMPSITGADDPALYAFMKSKGLSKLKWSYLTDFQISLLERKLPKAAIDTLKMENELGNAGYSRRSNGRGFGRGGGGGGELDFAFSMFKQYNKRTGSAPAAYAEYVNMPNNPALKSEFLRNHPEVAKWVKDGPMANMPPLYAEIVANIMVKYGKWTGEAKEVGEITDLAFAREQMARWNKRGDSLKPATYDLWVNMPTGMGKAEYLAQHPEIQNWIQLGPMANMPESYKVVVRDIMTRYGEWTAASDPLGLTIAEYYKTPKWAREKFLEDHPELPAYWRASRNPAEQAMSDLMDQFFSIPSGSARKSFMALHPELQQHFVDKRSERYEQFLTQVALFMGQNPAMFQEYLTKSNEIMAELLKKFSQPSLATEVSAHPNAASLTTTEGGRVRRRLY